MAFRNKIKSLLTNKEPENTQPNVDISEATTATTNFIMQEEMVREFSDDPTPDYEVIENTEKIYFSDLGFDANLYELEKLPEVLNEEELDKYRNTLRRQHQAVSREMSKKILEKQSEYVRELDRVMDLEANLQKATVTSAKGRNRLNQAKQEIVVGSLEILAKNRRKMLLQKLLESLHFIKTLQQTDVRLKELLQEKKYASAIQLCLECQHAAVTLHHYTCINELSAKLQDLLEQIEVQLDVALSKICNKFVDEDYTKIQGAYKLLGKTQVSVDQLQMHFVNTINTVAVATLADELKIVQSDISYSNLCKSIPLEMFITSLNKLCKVFWEIMYSYTQTVNWHERNKPEDDANMNVVYGQEYIDKKLEQGRGRIWQDIQNKIKLYVLSTDFGFLKYDDFICVLDVINRLINVGEGFSLNMSSQILQECVKVQTINYFKAYHRRTMEEVHMFLENEAWELWPVKQNFSILDMSEFKFIRTRLFTKNGGSDTPGKTNPKEPVNSTTSPFDEDLSTTRESLLEEEDVYGIEDDDDEDENDIPDELKQDFVDEKTGEEVYTQQTKKRRKSEHINENTPIVTNTTINVLRSFSKYMQMMIVLKPIAFEVLTCMAQLFDYYLYSVFSLFATNSQGQFESTLQVDEKLKACITRVYNEIILRDENISDGDLKIPSPELSPMIDLHNPAGLYGFTYRLIGVESLVFLAKQLREIHKNLLVLIPSQKQAFLGQFYGQSVDVTSELRRPVFNPIAQYAINYTKIYTMMTHVKWDPKEIMSQHNSYVDAIVNEYQELHNRIQSFSSIVPIPKESLLALWSNVIVQSNKMFVEGFSSAKRCTNEGRALMLLDYQQFLMKIDKLTELKPIPQRDFVENYIKAFYLVESELEIWLKEHQEYSAKQLNNLVTCGNSSHIGKKMKQKMLSLLDDLENKSKSP